MTDTSLIIAFLDPNNKQYQRSIKNIRSDAPQDKLVLWSKALIQVTENTYVSTAVVHRIQLD